MPPLTLADVLDLRAYERVREDYRAKIIARKVDRRVALGPVMTLVFECFDTVRFQVQEMARAEKIISDEGIQVELDIYNRLLPGKGELSATLFIELTSDDALREWLPRLVGIERQLGVAIDGELVASVPEAAHAAALTRETITPAVHYVRFGFTEAQVGAFAARRGGRPRGDPPCLRGPDRAVTGGAPGAGRGPAGHNKAPVHQLTRDNSVRKSLQTHGTCAILFVRRIQCRSLRSPDQKGL